MSRNIKKSKFIVPNDTIQDENLVSPAVELAQQQKNLFEVCYTTFTTNILYYIIYEIC